VLQIAPELHHRFLSSIFCILFVAEEVKSDLQHSLAQLRNDMFEF
jgi:hypothetical protein